MGTDVANEIFDALVASNKHELVILSRREIPASSMIPGVSYIRTSYEDFNQLARALHGVHTVLSFLVTQDDPVSMAQKNLIDAAVQAGVKRFAPSEWAYSDLKRVSWYAYKGEIRRYLEELNNDQKVLEYTLFQPGTFVNYFTHPHQSAKHLHTMELFFNFEKRKALLVDGGDNDRISLITVRDLANVVVQAIEFEGEWPVVGGIRGTDISVKEFIALGEKIRGGTEFNIEKVKVGDLENGTWETSWVPKLDHPSIPPEQVDFLSKMMCSSLLLAIHDGALSVSDEWNRLLPEYQFIPIEEFLAEAWQDKA